MGVGNSLINMGTFLRPMMTVSQEHRSMLIQHSLFTRNQGGKRKGK